MLKVRKSIERGRFDHGWLQTAHTFSFGRYFDPNFMGFRALRVINEDVIAPSAGFGKHPHRNMEIITYPISGALTHEDSTGRRATLQAGRGGADQYVQRMTAGRGIMHSEYNASQTEPLHLLQIWIEPKEQGLTPGYEDRGLPVADRVNRVRLIAGPPGTPPPAATINQDVSIADCLLESGRELAMPIAPGRHVWVQVIRGRLGAGEETLEAGDGVAVSDERILNLKSFEESLFLVFDLA